MTFHHRRPYPAGGHEQPPEPRMTSQLHGSWNGSSADQMGILLSIDRRVGEVAGDVKVIQSQLGHHAEWMNQADERIDEIQKRPSKSTAADMIRALPFAQVAPMAVLLILAVAGLLSPAEIKKLMLTIWMPGHQ